MSSNGHKSTLLDARQIAKTYQHRGGLGHKRAEVHAVRNVSFGLLAGESLGIVGESGSGKSTLARILVGLESPTSGQVFLDGHALMPPRSRQERLARGRNIQIVFQDPYTSLDPKQTAESLLNEVQRVHFDRDARERGLRTTALLDSVGLGSREGAARPRALSGGQRQRVAIARALAAEPEVLILDEAVSALDVSVQAQILNLLSDLRADFGLSYLVISHDLAVTRQLCDDVLVMHQGSMVEEGSVDDVLSSPRDAYTRRLLESVPRVGMLDELP